MHIPRRRIAQEEKDLLQNFALHLIQSLRNSDESKKREQNMKCIWFLLQRTRQFCQWRVSFFCSKIFPLMTLSTHTKKCWSISGNFLFDAFQCQRPHQRWVHYTLSIDTSKNKRDVSAAHDFHHSPMERARVTQMD